MSQTKRNALLLLAGAGVLIILLAMSLPTLHLFPGQPFSLETAQPTGAMGSTPLEASDLVIWLVRGFIAFAVIMLPVYVVYSLSSSKGRRRLILNIIMLILMLYLADYLHNHPLNNQQQQQEQAASSIQDILGQGGLPSAQFTAEPPAWLTPVIIVVAALITVLIIAAVILIFQRRKPKSDMMLDKLAETAQSTVEAIQSGSDFKVTVIRCYQEMMRVVKEEKGIARQATMTAREFEDQLVRRGLPQGAIQTLTRLFEQVRYGSLPTNPRDEDLALASLTEIVKACGGRLESQ